MPAIEFSFGEGVKIVDWLINIKIYVSEIVKLYKDTIIISLNNCGNKDLFIHIVQCWSACFIHNDQERSLPVVLY